MLPTLIPQMHGTGTPLGDPIEVGAVLEVTSERMKDGTGPGHKHLSMLRLLGCKSTVGHAEPAAGISGLIYAMQQVRSATRY